MAEFHYKVQGTAEDRPNVGVIQAEDAAEALAKANAVYGITEDAKPVKLELIDAVEFNKLEQENGHANTHRLE